MSYHKTMVTITISVFIICCFVPSSSPVLFTKTAQAVAVAPVALLSMSVKNYIGQAIYFDTSKRLDCVDVANQYLKDLGGNPPKWIKGEDNNDVLKLPDAKSILKNHSSLMRGFDYTFVSNPSSYKIGDIVVTAKGLDGHVAIVSKVLSDSIQVIEQDTYKDVPVYTQTYLLNYFEGAITNIKLK